MPGSFPRHRIPIPRHPSSPTTIADYWNFKIFPIHRNYKISVNSLTIVSAVQNPKYMFHKLFPHINRLRVRLAYNFHELIIYYNVFWIYPCHFHAYFFQNRTLLVKSVVSFICH